MTTNLHAHVSTFARDCDGGHGNEYITWLDDAERAQHEAAWSEQDQAHVNDFHEYTFKERVLGSAVSFHAEAEVHIFPGGFAYHQPTDEGYSSREVRWCEDDDCEDPTNCVYDEFAQAAGY